MEERFKLLPRTTRVILDTIGIKLTMNLIKEFGGTSFAIPADHLTGSVYNALNPILKKQTRVLMEEFRGENLIIPASQEEIEEIYISVLTDNAQFYESLNKYQDILPASAKEIIEVIGIKDAIELIKKYGGTTMIITNSERSYAYQDLLLVLSDEQVKKVIKHFSGNRLYIPKCDEAMIKIRNEEFWKAVEKLIIDLSVSQERAIFLLCPQFGITYRQAFNIKKEMGAVKEDNKQQALI